MHDFLLLGLRRTATTSIWDFLRTHPQICPPKYNKELSRTFLINKTIPEDNFIRLNFFPDKKTKYLIDATPGSFEYKEYIEKVLNFPEIRKIKIIFTLRNPLDRVYSLILYQMSLFYKFGEAIDYINENDEVNKEDLREFIIKEFYTYDGIKIAYDMVGKENILFIKIENLNNARDEIYEFLKIPPHKSEMKKVNTTSQNPFKFRMIEKNEEIKRWFKSNKEELIDMMKVDLNKMETTYGVTFNENHSLSFL
jgi:hypothetical protein